MKVSELINSDCIRIDTEMKDREEMLLYLSEMMYQEGYVNDRKKFLNALKEREKISSTAIGDMVAVPHAKDSSVIKAGVGAVLLKDGIDYGAEDREKTKLFFVILSPEGGSDLHIDALSALSSLLMNDGFLNEIMKSRSKEEFLNTIEKYENTDKKEAKEGDIDICAVTACPTGIAHTYMAAEGLEKAAEKSGVSIKVEKNGASGIKDKLTDEEIKNAKAIIVAADRKVEMARFNGKKVIIARASQGINNAEKLIKEALDENAPIYTHKDEMKEGQDSSSVGVHGIYTNLMNGVSYMLPFVIGGGILIALSFLLDNYEIDPSNFGMNTPIAAFFKTAGGAAFGFMLPVLSGYIALSIADKPALAAGFTGGILAEQGGSGFLGALIAGFTAGYIMLFIKRILEKLPSSLNGISSVLLYPLLSIFLTSAAIIIVLNPPVKAVNDGLYSFLNSMGDTSRVVLGVILASMMAVDMGGPVNKAAYVFGTAAISQGRFDIMSAVMIGGMVPPISIALCSTFFKNKFTKQQQKSAAVNYIMGLSFITEGAIPFAASDPLRVIPSCVAGSAVAGGLSMFFNCTLRAPHGGIFVLPVIGNWLYFLIALAAGSAVGAVIMAVLKNNAEEE